MLMRRARKGKETQALDNKPGITQDLEIIWELFGHLHAQRGITSIMNITSDGRMQSSIIPNPLNVRDVIAMLDLNDCDGDFAIEVFEILLAMDKAYVKFEQGKKKSKEK